MRYLAQKRKFAASSLETNCSNATFRKLFPELVELQQEREEEKALLNKLRAADGTATGSSSSTSSASPSSNSSSLTERLETDEMIVLGILGVLLLSVLTLLYYWFS